MIDNFGRERGESDQILEDLVKRAVLVLNLSGGEIPFNAEFAAATRSCSWR
jgi:stringent starvation protein B